MPLFRNGPYEVDWLNGDGDTLIIVFSSIGHDPTRTPSPEFVATTRGLGRVVFVRDAQRSWAHDPAFAGVLQETLTRMQAMGPVSRILTMGLSMGAFSALAATRVLPVDVVLSFGPQWTLDTEPRWTQWTARLSELGPQTAFVPEQGWICIFHGLRDDLIQARHFPPRKGLDHILFPDLGHSDLMAHLRSRGVLAGLAQAALAGDRRRLLRIATASGGILRQRMEQTLLHPTAGFSILPTSIEGGQHAEPATGQETRPDPRSPHSRPM